MKLPESALSDNVLCVRCFARVEVDERFVFHMKEKCRIHLPNTIWVTDGYRIVSWINCPHCGKRIELCEKVFEEKKGAKANA